jgi:hypothetical protein
LASKDEEIIGIIRIAGGLPKSRLQLDIVLPFTLFGEQPGVHHGIPLKPELQQTRDVRGPPSSLSLYLVVGQQLTNVVKVALTCLS